MACRKQGGNGWRRWLETLGLLAAGMELMFPVTTLASSQGSGEQDGLLMLLFWGFVLMVVGAQLVPGLVRLVQILWRFWRG